jgi:tetratricopeptide (TPR) repeat protein
MKFQQQERQQRPLNKSRFILMLATLCFICSGCSLCSAPFDDYFFVCGDGCYFQPSHNGFIGALALSLLMFILGVIGVIGYRELGKKQGKYEQAEPLYQRALAIKERVLGKEHPSTATGLNNLALLYYNQGKYEQAEPLFKRALAIRERVLGKEHPDTKRVRENYNDLLQKRSESEESDIAPTYKDSSFDS